MRRSGAGSSPRSPGAAITVVFFERDVPYYAAHRDLARASRRRACYLYTDWEQALRAGTARAGRRRRRRWSRRTAPTALRPRSCVHESAAPGARLLRPGHAGDAGATAGGRAGAVPGPARTARLRPGAELHRRCRAARTARRASARAGAAALRAAWTRRCTVRVPPVEAFRARPVVPGHLRRRPAGRRSRRSSSSLARARCPRQRFVIGGAQYPQDFPWTAQHLLRAAPAAGRSPGLLLLARG